MRNIFKLEIVLIDAGPIQHKVNFFAHKIFPEMSAKLRRIEEENPNYDLTELIEGTAFTLPEYFVRKLKKGDGVAIDCFEATTPEAEVIKEFIAGWVSGWFEVQQKVYNTTNKITLLLSFAGDDVIYEGDTSKVNQDQLKKDMKLMLRRLTEAKLDLEDKIKKVGSNFVCYSGV